MTERDQAVAATPFLYGRIWLHWLDTDEVRALSGRALRLWILLHAHAAGKDQTDAFRAALERESGISDQNMRACFRELESAGLLEREPGAGYGAAGRKSTVYKLPSPPSVREREERARLALQGDQEKRGSNQAPEQAKGGSNRIPVGGSNRIPVGGSNRIPVGGSNRIPSQDPSQDSSQDPAQEKHTAPGVFPPDFSEQGEEQPGTAFRAAETENPPAAGASMPAELDHAPRAQVASDGSKPESHRAQADWRPTSPEWPNGEPSHPSSAWSRIGAILPLVPSAEKQPCEGLPAAGIEDSRAQVENGASSNGSHVAQNGDSQALYTLPPRLQAQADARDLVLAWWRDVKQIHRYQPIKSELAYAAGLIKKHGKDEAYELVRQGDLRLKESGMLGKTANFCGLKTVLGEV